MRTHLFHAIVSGLIAGAAGIVYNKVYSELLWVDFLAVINPISILGACLVGCISASLGYYALSLACLSNEDLIQFSTSYSCCSHSLQCRFLLGLNYP